MATVTRAGRADQEGTDNPEVNLNEASKIEISKKKEQATITIGFWEKRVESYKILLQSSEARLDSSRAGLRETEKRASQLAEETDDAQATQVTNWSEWATEIATDIEGRLADLIAINTPAQVSLFGPIDNEKLALEQVLAPVAKTSATRTGNEPSIFVDWIALKDMETEMKMTRHERALLHARKTNPPEATTGCNRDHQA